MQIYFSKILIALLRRISKLEVPKWNLKYEGTKTDTPPQVP